MENQLKIIKFWVCKNFQQLSGLFFLLYILGHIVVGFLDYFTN